MKQYVVDAFTDHVFAGNPAAVCVMDQWLPDELMQKIAIENNLSETAFAVKEGDTYHLRWFTPGGEVNLCGHATLATAYIITRFIEVDVQKVSFDTLSGRLIVERTGNLLTMDFPSFQLKPLEISDRLTAALGIAPVEAYMGEDIVCVLKDEEQIRNVVANQEMIRNMDGLCLHITAQGDNYDCVTRTFAPKCNVTEDPVCGRGHCHVIPLWAKKLGNDSLVAYQASARGGILHCRFAEDRTFLSGQAVLYSEAEIFV